MKKNLLLLFCFAFLMSVTSIGQNLIPNGSFENDFTSWNNLVGGTGVATFSVDTNDKFDSAKAMKVVVTTAGTNGYDVQSINSPWASVSGQQYTLSFYAKADVAGKTLRVVQQTNTYAARDFTLTTSWQKYEWAFTAQEANLQLRFNFPVAGTFNIDQVVIPPPPSVVNLIPNGGFENNFTNWTNLAGGTSSAVFSVETADKVQGTKSMKVVVATAGANAYDVQSINSPWASVSGNQYTLSFYAKADAAGKTLRVVQQTNTYASRDFNLTTAWQRYEWIFTAQEANLQLRFNFPVAGTFYIDTVSIPAPVVIIVPPPPYTPPGPPIATGKSKFLGSAYSNAQKINFGKYWNQVTPENGGKWGSVEATRNVMNWSEMDSAYKLAKDSGYPFKMHTLIWGSQQPSWIETLDSATQLAEIKEWFQAVAARYPAIDFIEVVNEPLHAPPDATHSGKYINALGGSGVTGWDWIITSFQLARQYFPATTKLWINDYSIINSTASTATYVQIVNLLKARNLIDAVGEQGHAFTTRGTPASTMTNNLNTLAATGLPLYITELDIDGPPAETPQGNNVQLLEYQRVFPLFWEHPAIKGITMWGHRPGHWRTAEGAPLVYANGAEKEAMVWLKQYVQNTVLPVTLTSFEARRSSDKVAITWSTTNEINNDKYVIERSSDGTTYTPLITVKANANGHYNYSVFDDKPIKGINYYRLVQYDKDGRKTNFGVRIVNFGTNENLYVQVYPNPATSYFTVRTEADASSKSNVTLTDGIGRILKTFTMPASGVYNISAQGLVKGIYFIRIDKNGINSTIKVLVDN
jgi:GH35 family endo-1,4-beta-xylanase